MSEQVKAVLQPEHEALIRLGGLRLAKHVMPMTAGGPVMYVGRHFFLVRYTGFTKEAEPGVWVRIHDVLYQLESGRQPASLVKLVGLYPLILLRLFTNNEKQAFEVIT